MAMKTSRHFTMLVDAAVTDDGGEGEEVMDAFLLVVTMTVFWLIINPFFWIGLIVGLIMISSRRRRKREMDQLIEAIHGRTNPTEPAVIVTPAGPPARSKAGPWLILLLLWMLVVYGSMFF